MVNKKLQQIFAIICFLVIIVLEHLLIELIQVNAFRTRRKNKLFYPFVRSFTLHVIFLEKFHDFVLLFFALKFSSLLSQVMKIFIWVKKPQIWVKIESKHQNNVMILDFRTRLLDSLPVV